MNHINDWDSVYFIPPIHHCCGNDPIRAMHYIHIKNRHAFATDAHVLVHFDIAQVFSESVCEKLEGKLIHKNTWRALCTMASKYKVTGLVMAVDGETIVAKDFDFQGHRTFDLKTEGLDKKFPDCTKTWNEIIKASNESIEQFKYGLSPEVFGKIAKAIDPQGGLVIFPVRPNMGVLIGGRPQRKDDMVIYGLCMPTMLSLSVDSSEERFNTLPQ